jgi:hypothetical protein
MKKTNLAALAAALALVLAAPAAFAQEPEIEPVQQPIDPDPTETGDPIPNEPTTATATALPSSADRSHPTFAELDTDADGFVAASDIPAEHELSLQFAVADTDQDDRLSQSEFDAYQSAPEEEEAEE